MEHQYDAEPVSSPDPSNGPYCIASTAKWFATDQNGDIVMNRMDIAKTTIVYSLGYALIAVVAFGGAL
jgi:hypothetical protein